MGVPEDVSRQYGDQVSKGNYLIMVVAEKGEQEQNASQILAGAGSNDVESYPYQVRTRKFPGDETYMAEERLNTREDDRSMRDDGPTIRGF